jgi:hypothetical protein
VSECHNRPVPCVSHGVLTAADALMVTPAVAFPSMALLSVRIYKEIGIGETSLHARHTSPLGTLHLPPMSFHMLANFSVGCVSHLSIAQLLSACACAVLSGVSHLWSVVDQSIHCRLWICCHSTLYRGVLLEAGPSLRYDNFAGLDRHEGHHPAPSGLDRVWQLHCCSDTVCAPHAGVH